MSEQVVDHERAHVVYEVDARAHGENDMAEVSVRMNRDAIAAREKLLEWLHIIDPSAEVTAPTHPSIAPSSWVGATLEAVKKLVADETRPDYIAAAVHIDS